MVDRSANLKKIADVKFYAYAVYDQVIVSIGDTITPGEFSDEEDLKKVVLMKNSDGSEITVTKLLNVVTVGAGAGTDDECTLFVFGRRV